MIDADTLAQVVAHVDQAGLDTATVAGLRQAWPLLHFTWCSEDEVPARLKPVAEGRDFGLYLVSGADHCVAFTDHPEAATGLVLAAHTED